MTLGPAILLYHLVFLVNVMKEDWRCHKCTIVTAKENMIACDHLVWRSLTPPSKIGKGSGKPRIIDLCHKQNSGSSNQISERNSYIIFITSLQHTRAVRESGGKRRMAGVAEKRVALAAKETTRKIGYTDVKACQLDVIAGVVNGRDVSRFW